MALKIALTTVPVFQFVSPDATQKLARVAKVVEKNKGDAVLMHGEPVQGIYIVAEGAVGVYPPGAGRPLVTLGVGESFGEMSFLEKTKASVTIRGEQPGTKLVVLVQSELKSLVDEDAELGRALFHGMALTLSQKLRTTTDRITAELHVGRQLLLDLTSEEATTKLQSLPEEVVQQNAAIMSGLDGSLKLAEELARKLPEKAGSLNEVVLKIRETKAQCQQFYPRLSRHISAITNFIASMEEFILNSTRH